MTYEEKLELILKAILEASKASRKGHPTKLYITTENLLTQLHRGEIEDILLQLQDDEQVIKVRTITNRLLPADKQPKVDYFLLDVPDHFIIWYETRMLNNISSIKNLDWINLLKAFDVAISINEQLQFSKGTTVLIPSLPQIVRFSLLFPQDSIGTRRNYQQYRWEGVQYLQNMGVVLEAKPQSDDMLSYGNIQVKVNLVEFESFFKEIRNEYNKRNEEATKTSENNRTEKPKVMPTKIGQTVKSKTVWPEDFKWESKNFVFGKYGSISFKSKDRNFILETLTSKKGGWATLKELKGNKDAGYVRSTIKQIEDRLPAKARKHVTIVSTQDDDSEDKPNVGAYRMRVKL